MLWKTAFFITLSGFIILIVLIVAFKLKTNMFVNVVERIIGYFSKSFASKVDNIFNSFAAGLKCLDSFNNSCKIFATSVIQWALMGFTTWIALISFNIYISIFSASFLMVLVVLGCALPPSPGGIGPTQFISVLVLNYYGVNGGEAMGFSIVQNFLTFAVGTILGIYFLFKESMKFSEIIKFSEEKR